MNILRYCKHCGVEFIAHKITTQYCCKECERKESRHREKIKKQKDSLMQNGDADSPERILANSMEFLSPSQAAALLGVSRATIYRYAVDGVIKAVQLKGITIIRRSDIDTFFNEAPAYKKRVSRRKKKEADSEYYSTREIQEKYHICRKAILARCDKYNIPKVYEGRNTFFKKVHVDARFAELLEPIDLDNYYTISQVQERLNMNNNQNVLSFVYRHDIPRITRGRDVYYSKVHIDNFKRKGSEADANWYTYAEIIEKFGFTKDQITKYIHCSNKIKTEKRGKYTMIYRSQFDKLIIEKKFGGIKEDPETGKITFINQITKKEHTDKARVPCPPAPDGYYSAEEVSLKYKVIIKHVQELTREAKIPKIMLKGWAFYEVSAIEALFGTKKIYDDISEWITPDEIENIYKMTPVARRTFTHRHNIPSKVEFGKIFYSKKHIDRVKNLDFDGKENYYSIQDIMEKYHVTKDMAFYYSGKKNMTKYKCGQQVYILKKDVDEYMAEKAARADLPQVTLT